MASPSSRGTPTEFVFSISSQKNNEQSPSPFLLSRMVAGIAAALVGASVTCVDIDQYALQAIKLNAKANKVNVEVSDTPVEADVILVGCPSFKTLEGTFPEEQLDLIKSYDRSYLGYKVLRDEYTRGFFESGEFEIIDRKTVPTTVHTEGRTARDVIIMSYVEPD